MNPLDFRTQDVTGIPCLVPSVWVFSVIIVLDIQSMERWVISGILESAFVFRKENGCSRGVYIIHPQKAKTEWQVKVIMIKSSLKKKITILTVWSNIPSVGQLDPPPMPAKNKNSFRTVILFVFDAFSGSRLKVTAWSEVAGRTNSDDAELTGMWGWKILEALDMLALILFGFCQAN